MSGRPDPITLVAAAVAVALVLACAGAPLVEAWLGVDAQETDLLKRFAAGSAGHPLGNDEVGRDLLTRLLYGGRISLLVGIVSALMAATIGSLLGILAGYSGGRFDAVLMRLTDGIIALPLLAVLIVLAAIDLKKLGIPDAFVESRYTSLVRIVLITALFSWTTVARLARAATLTLKSRDFVRAAVAMGAPPWRVMLRHVLPNAMSPILVATALAVGEVIKFESVLSFLGLGIQPPMPSWGNMLTNAQEMIWTAPHLAIWPGCLILVAVACCNLLADALARWLDPRRRQQR
ncbi:MAG: ABC transporter permease [Alphaproteobacteria bacterium]|nr:ABC transporter permease [Alphaproteobacteria bacterium]